jgi:hypothetical protein
VAGGFLGAARFSLLGDVYAEPSRWRPLSFGTFFSTGWDEAWAGPPNGDGGAPRQGWLNAADGVFYRLGIATFGFAHDVGDHGNGYTSALTLYTPLSRRFELRWDLPIVAARRGAPPDDDYQVSANDFAITPRFLLYESRNLSQSFNVTVRMPTGNPDTGTGIAAIAPSYEFWSNPWSGLVVRGGLALSVPFSHQAVHDAGARTAFLGDLAAGYYFTPHELTPVGDLVWYVATNLTQATDGRGPSLTTLTFTPGFRSHLGQNWYLLGGVELPATHPNPFDYQLLAGLMKVF